MTTTEPTWRPLGYDGRESVYDALHDGVPDWMSESFWWWMRAQFTYSAPRAMGGASMRFDRDLLRTAERKCRFTTGYLGIDPREGMSALRVAAERQQGLELDLADFAIAHNKRGQDPTKLELILKDSSSMWKVGTRDGKPGLVRRVPEGAQVHADHVMAKSGQAGKILASAWGNAYGLNPDPSNAYTLAVKAVEEAAIPVVVPKQDEPALGHVIGQLKKDGNWQLPLTREHTEANTAEIVIKMCQALVRGQHDRHGASSHPIPKVTQEEAETAVTLAVSLVHWFDSGMVARR